MIVPMKHISLFALKKDERRIMKALQKNGVIQLSEADGANGDAELSPALSSASGLFKTGCEAELAKKQGEVTKLKSAISRLGAFMPKAGMLEAAPERSEDELVLAVPEALKTAERLDEIQKDISHNKSEKERKQALIKSLAPFAAVTIPLSDIKPTRTADFLLGTAKAEKLDMLREEGVSFDSFGDAGKAAVLAAVPKEASEETLAALRAAGFEEAQLPAINGLPAEETERLRREIAEADKNTEELSRELAKLGEKAETLKMGMDGALIEEARARARCELFATRETFLLTGWARSDEADKLESAIAEATEVYCLETRDPYDDEQPPTYCKNNKFFAPFEFITNMYSPPDPRGFDPTVVMAPFYLLFFGLMMGDTGYGLIITLGALLMLKLKKPKGGTEQVCRILVWGGISTMICGLLTGTFFGMNWRDLFGQGFPFPLIDPMVDQMTALVLYCGLGFFQIIAGMVVSMVLHFSKGDWQTAVFDIGSWLMIFAGIALMILGKGSVKYAGYGLIGVGLLLIIVFGGRNKKGIGRVTGGLGKLYDITGFFSDVLSYARVFALGLATGVMGSVFNMISSMVHGALKGVPVVGPVIGFIVAAILLAVLHLFCVGINALGAFIHCARLQFIEYYNRFYTPGGRLYKPLSPDTKYNKVIK
ncbi:MAG: V-type ATP synthase subunit I [Clostridiales bacterium]|nr:V-type ATP synthase subunit I [Clostridiales bacterium]